MIPEPAPCFLTYSGISGASLLFHPLPRLHHPFRNLNRKLIYLKPPSHTLGSGRSVKCVTLYHCRRQMCCWACGVCKSPKPVPAVHRVRQLVQHTCGLMMWISVVHRWLGIGLLTSSHTCACLHKSCSMTQGAAWGAWTRRLWLFVTQGIWVLYPSAQRRTTAIDSLYTFIVNHN